MSIRRSSLLGLGLALAAGCASEQPRLAVAELDGEYARVRFEGYYAMSCSGPDHQRYVEEGEGRWRAIEQRPSEFAFLDGEWLGPDLSMCCWGGCYPVEERTIDTRVYVRVGEQPVPAAVAKRRAEQLDHAERLKGEARSRWETQHPEQRIPWEDVEVNLLQYVATLYPTGLDSAAPFVAPAYEKARPEGRMRATFHLFTDRECTVRDTAAVVFQP